MTRPELTVVAGTRARDAKSRLPCAKGTREQLAGRWRRGVEAESASTRETRDVIPLLDGWVRLLERDSGAESPRR